MSKKKILYLITKSNYGGAQKYVYELASEAKRRGYDVTVAAGGTGKKNAKLGKLTTLLTDAGVPFFTIKNFMRDMSFWSDIKAFFEVFRLLKKSKPDVLHVTSSKAGGVGAVTGRLARVPHIVFTSHGLTMDETWRPRWQRVLITLGTWITIRLAHQTIMISSETYDRTKRLLGLKNRVQLIFNGVSTTPLLSSAEAKAKLVPHLPSNVKLIGGIGELHPNKNWSNLIEALKNLPDSVHLVIIGEGEEREKLETLSQKLNVADRVHLLGFVAAQPYIKLWDIFILPSQKEGLPYVLLEAGLAERPVIASDLPGNRDIIEHQVNGLLLTPAPKVLAGAIRHLLESEHIAHRYAEKLYQTVTGKFSIKRMYQETFAVYLLE